MNVIDLDILDSEQVKEDDPFINITIDGEKIETIKLDYLYSLSEQVEEELKQACTDAVSREEVIKAVTKEELENGTFTGAKMQISGLPPVQPTQKWIPVTERLPEDCEDVLATDGIHIFVAWLRGEWSSFDDNYWVEDPIVAWMPLPAPYEPRESED